MVALHIVITVPSLNRDFGGPSQKAGVLGAALRELGHEVEVLGCGFSEETGGLPVLCRFHGNELPRTLAPLRHALDKADVVHILGFREPVSAATVFLAQRSRTPYVLEPVGTHRPRIRSLRLKRAFDACLGNGFFKSAAAIIATSDLEARELAADGVACDRISVRPNGVSIDELLPLPPRGAFRRANRIPEDVPVILSLGRITVAKRLTDLARALAELPGVRAVVAGPDYGDGALHELMNVRRELHLDERLLIVTTGLWEKQKSQAFADVDCLCMPSEMENFGIAAVEAAAAGLPVVVSDRCGGKEWLDPAASVVVPRGDIDLLVKGLSRVLEDRTALASARAGAHRLRRTLDWRVLAHKQLEIYEQALGDVGVA